MPPAKAEVIVVGGGLAGLTAALHLAERGLRPLVLEADPEHLGGRLKATPNVTLEHQGQTWTFAGEHGVHAIWSPYRNLQALWVRHGIRPVLVPAQEETWILGNGRRVRRAPIGSAIRGSWIPAPLHYLGLFARPRFWAMLTPHDALALLPVFATLMSALSIDPLAEDQPLHGLSLADVCRGWSPHLTALFTGLARNALPANPEHVPASSFFAFLRFYTLRRRDAWVFSYLPRASPRAMIDPLAAQLAAHGGEVRLGAEVTRIARHGDGWRVQGEGLDLTGDALILAVDAPSAEKLLCASPDTAEIAAGLRLPSGWATAVVRFWFGGQPTRRGAEAGMFSGDFVLDNFFWLHRIYDDAIRWGRATGGSALEAHIYGPPELLEIPDAALLARARVDVLRAWPELRERVLHQTLTRHPATHTLLRAGRPEEHLGVETPWAGLHCCGDWVRDSTPAMFMERACVTGIRAANAVLRARDLAPWPLLDHYRPELLAWAVELAMQRVRRALRARVRRRQA